MVNNGTLHYDHDRDGTHTQIAGCESNFRGVTQDTYIAIRYENNVLTVSAPYNTETMYTETTYISTCDVHPKFSKILLIFIYDV